MKFKVSQVPETGGITVKLTRLKAQGRSLAQAASKALDGAQQCPEILQPTYETNLIEVSLNWTILKLYMTSPITSCEAERSFSKQSIIQKRNFVSHSAGKTELSFCSLYRKLYLNDRCHMKRQSNGMQSNIVGRKVF